MCKTRKLTVLSRWISCMDLVKPGVDDTPTALDLLVSNKSHKQKQHTIINIINTKNKSTTNNMLMKAVTTVAHRFILVIT